MTFVDAEVTRKRADVDIAVNAHLVPTRLRGEAGQLSRMARNLIDNAARYASTTVDVRVWLDRGGAHLRVCDDGPGIPVADRQRVFERFVRLHQDRGRSSGGSGLGLAIVAQIIAAHHGSVEISTAGGAGSGTARCNRRPWRSTSAVACHRPSVPVPTVTTTIPSAVSPRSMVAANRGSSSTTRTFIAAARTRSRR